MNAKERRAVLLAEQALQKVEFSYEDDETDISCPICGGCNPLDAEGVEEESIGHSSTCKVGQALVAIKEILFEDGSKQ